MKANTVEVIDRGMKCLSDHIGARDTEIFIATILKERFDYTEWRRGLVEDIDSFDKLDSFVTESQKKAVFKGTPEVTI